MVFSTPYFLFLYLPAVLLLYYVSPKAKIIIFNSDIFISK